MVYYSVKWSTPAEKDRDGIYKYIAEQSGPIRAATLAKAFEDAAANLSFMPQRFRMIGRKQYRMRVVKKHLLFYTINERKKTVTIKHIIHSSRNWIELLL